MEVKINKEIKELIEGNALALATVGKNGDPYCIAVGDVKVVADNQVLIGDCYMNKTIKNIERKKDVCLVVWNKDWEKDCIGYQFKGIAEYFINEKWHGTAKKIHKGFPCKGAILITINNIKKLA